ncbi:hypothetical protein PV783_34165 [Chitinophaga sp. CC14]
MKNRINAMMKVKLQGWFMKCVNQIQMEDKYMRVRDKKNSSAMRFALLDCFKTFRNVVITGNITKKLVPQDQHRTFSIMY